MSAGVGYQLALAGMTSADQAASGEWKAAWDSAIAHLASTGEDFTTDDVRAIAGAPADHPNAAGARIQSAVRAGLIRKVGFRPSRRDALHAHNLALWRGTDKARESAA